MEPGVVVVIAMVCVLTVAFLVAYSMNWLGLFMSKEEMRQEADQAKERMRLWRAADGPAAPGTGNGAPAARSGVPALAEAPAPVRGV